MAKQNYTLGVTTDMDGEIQYATLNKNKTCTATLIACYTKLPLFVHERIALLKVADSYKAIMLGIGRRLMPTMFTIYLNANEYKEIYKLRKSADDSREESQK